MTLQVDPPLGETSRNSRHKMAARRRNKNMLSSGLYVHSSPPRVLQMNPSVIRQWLRNGDVEKLEQVVLEGQGFKLVGEYSPDPKARTFLKTVPQYMAKIEMLHDAVTRGQLEDVQKILREDPRKKLAVCKGQAGVGLLHKAIYYDHNELASWLVNNYPASVTVKDREGRTALHYCAATKDPSPLWEFLVAAGADDSVEDTKGNLATYYMDHPKEISLPEPKKLNGAMKRYTDGKDGLVVTRANIRIWIHDRDLGRLQQMLWEGHGGKLRVETSNNPRVKRFLDAVPYIMGTIKDVHTAAIHNNVDIFKKRTAEPVPEQIMLSKDENGLNPLHKAAGLGHSDIVDLVMQRTSKPLNVQDNEGRTPLHYAATLKDNGEMYDSLVDRGADEHVEDCKGKTPSYYRQKPLELDATRLRVVPDAPRTATMFPPAWDWRLLNNMTYDFGPINGVANSEEDFGSVQEVAQIQKPPTPEILYLDVPSPMPDDKHRPTSSRDDEDEGVGEDDERVEETRSEQDEYSGGGEAEAEAEVEVDEGGDEPPPYDQGIDGMRFNEDVLEEHARGSAASHVGDRDTAEDEGVGDERGATGEDDVGLSGRNTRQQLAASPEVAHHQGTVVGDPEADNDLDPDVQELVKTGNMEELAGLVLTGNGRRLVGQKSEDPELQNFLNNVPVYIGKINIVHRAAREGQLRELQASLDRRKFAVARDTNTRLGATPLHVATLFGNTSIVRYLGARFPETLNAKDNDSRTPLHYAATINDNGHYYNLLLNLGANPTLKDSRGRTAEYYMRNPERLTHKMLLEEYGASQQVADDTLADKVPDDTVSSRRDLDDLDLLDTMERCYELIRSEDNAFKPSDNLIRKHLKPIVFHRIKLFITRQDHHLLDLIWPGAKQLPVDSKEIRELNQMVDIACENGGVLVPDYESYRVYGDFLFPLVKELHGLHFKSPLNPHPSLQYVEDIELDSDDEEFEKEVKEKSLAKDNAAIFERYSKFITSFRIECVRNITDLPLPACMTLSQLESAERALRNALENLDYDNISENHESHPPQGMYYSLESLMKDDSEIMDLLKKAGLMVRLSEDNPNFDVLLHGPSWPHGRGVFVFKEGNIAAWVNVQEHFRIVGSSQAVLEQTYKTIGNILGEMEDIVEFKRDELLGYISTRPGYLGTGLRITVDLRLPKLSKDGNLMGLCAARGLMLKADDSLPDKFKAWNRQSLGITEYQILKNFVTAVFNIVELEKGMTGNGVKFSGFLGNMFTKKK